LHISSLASIYHKPARILVPNVKHRKLYESPVLVLEERPGMAALSSPPNTAQQTNNNAPLPINNTNNNQQPLLDNSYSYNPYSNDIQQQQHQQQQQSSSMMSMQKKQQQPQVNLLDLDDDYSAVGGATSVPPSIIDNSYQMQQQPQQLTIADPALNAASVSEALATLSFNGQSAPGLPLQPYAQPRELMLPANLGKGMEISGTFARRNGQILLELSVTNRALQPLGDFAIQFNKNTFGLIPDAPLSLRSPLPPNQSAETALQLAVNPMTHSQPTSPVNQLHVAVKNSVGVFFFKCDYSLHVLFREDGKCTQQEFLNLWKSWPESQTGGSLNLEGLNFANIDKLRYEFLIYQQLMFKFLMII
jgi:hypothetical protein